MPYIDADTYNSLTGRNAAEATDARINRAARLLDTRIGNYVRVDDSTNTYDGFKLDLANLKAYQVEIVREWVAWMIAALYDNGDKPNTFANIKLGRFSVSENSKDTNNEIPEAVRYADMQLRDARLINTQLRSSRYASENDEW